MLLHIKEYAEQIIYIIFLITLTHFNPVLISYRNQSFDFD